MIGTAEIPAEHLATAAARFLAGTVPGQHMVFPPSPAQFATEARDHWYRALNAQHQEQQRLRPPSKDDISEAERARVKAGFDDLIAEMSAKLRTDDAEAELRRKAILNKTNARFAPDMSETAMRQRLGFSVGDPQGDRDVA